MRSREEIVESARRLAREKDYAGAIRRYEALLRLDPDDLEARLKIGYLHACNRDREAAASTYLEVAHAYEKAGDPETAVKVLTQVLRLQPERIEAHFWLGELLGRLGRPAQGRRWLEAAESLLLERGRPEEALRAVEAMVALDPGNVALLVRLAEAFVREGRPEDALPVFGEAAEILRMAEWTEEFVKVAERITYLAPRDAALGKELATLYLRKRDPRAALRKLQRCYQSRPEDPETLGLIVECFMDIRELGKAVTILEVLMDLYFQRGEVALGEATRQRILSIAPHWAERHRGEDGRDTQVESPPLELFADPDDSPVPLTTDERQIEELERSLQTDAGDGVRGRRFLPAVTAPHQASPRSSATALGSGHSEPGHAGFGDHDDVPHLRTRELDLEDIEEVVHPGEPREQAQGGPSGPRAREDRFLPVSTVPDAPSPAPGRPRRG